MNTAVRASRVYPVSLRRVVQLGIVIAISLGTSVGCGSLPAVGTASSSRTGSPSSSPIATTLPDPTRLTSQGCSTAPPATAARALGGYFSIRPAADWTDTGDYVHTESLLLELAAPVGYGYSPIRIRFYAFPYDVKADFGTQATAHTLAVDEATTHKRFTSPRLSATSVSDCSVAAEPTALFGYADGDERGYWLLIVHHDRLLAIQLLGNLEIADQAIQDALAMMGSITWSF